MNKTHVLVVVWMSMASILIGTAPSRADEKTDRAGVADSLAKLSSSAATLASTAKASDDRGARKKFAPAASELSDDLAALSRRATKDVPWKAIAKDAADISRDADKLVDLADEADDKDTRKSLRAQATSVVQGVAAVRKSIDAASSSSASAAQAPSRFTGRLVNNSDSCSWAENLKFVVSRDGQSAFTSQMVFPGKDVGTVLAGGRYLVQFFDTSGKLLGQNNLDASRDGWMFKSGCVNQD